MNQGVAKSNFMGRTEGDKKVHPFRENVEAGMLVVCPSCGKTERMDCLGNCGWGCPWCHAKILTVNGCQLKQTACLCPTPPGAGETSGLVDEQPSLSKSCLERRRRFAILREALRSE